MKYIDVVRRSTGTVLYITTICDEIFFSFLTFKFVAKQM